MSSARTVEDDTIADSIASLSVADYIELYEKSRPPPARKKLVSKKTSGN